jgi:putative redox protein
MDRTYGRAEAQDTGQGGFQLLMDLGPARFVADQPLQRGGLGLGPSPHELVAAALAACTAQTLRLYAKRKAWPLAATRVAVTSASDPGATPSEHFERTIEMDGPLDASQRARLLEIAEACPIHRLLANGASVSTRLIGDAVAEPPAVSEIDQP